MTFLTNLKDLKTQIVLAFFAVGFGLIKSLSDFVYEQNIVGVDVVRSVGYGLGCYAVLNLLLALSGVDWKAKPTAMPSCRLWGIFFAGFLILHTVCWLTFWPANISQDNIWILYSGLWQGSNHPILYVAFLTLLREIGLFFGSMHYGILAYTALQILAVDAFMAYLLTWIYKKSIPGIMKALFTAYYFAVPAFSVMSVNMIKDTPWAIAISVLSLALYEIISAAAKGEKKRHLALYISLFFVIILRNNGIYIAIATVLAILFAGRRLWKTAAKAFAVIVVAQAICFGAMRATNCRQLFSEMVGVPIQQVLATVNADGAITDEQKTFLAQIAEPQYMKRYYNPYSSDSFRWGNLDYKRDFLEAHRLEFLKVWAQMLPNNFGIYTKAYLQAVYWWWAPRQEGTVDIRWPILHVPNIDKFIAQNNLKPAPIIGGDAGSFLRRWYGYDKNFLREGVMVWLLLAMALLYGLKRRKWQPLLIYVPCLALWLTLMVAAPVASSVRYIYAYMYLLPFFATALFADSSDEKELA